MSYTTGRNFLGAPPVVGNLVIVNAAIWIVAWLIEMRNPEAFDVVLGNVALFPAESPFFRLWQPLTYMFMHGGWTHLIFNMFTLWMFGRFIEHDLGSRRFLFYYMVCGIGAGLFQLLVSHMLNAPLNVPTVGASGAIYGVLLAFGMLHPNDIIMPLIPPIPMKAKWAVLIFCAIELFMGIRGSDNVAHFAHLGGALWGFLLLLYWKKRKKIYTY